VRQNRPEVAADVAHHARPSAPWESTLRSPC
jgi:hypothetical protein